jgi:thiol-disulfide isomerase/thioredoxin
MTGKFIRLGWMAVLLALNAGVSARELQPFGTSTAARIKSEFTGRPFVLALWSLSCEPCRESMSQWGALRRKYPGMVMILVAADDPREHEAISAFLAQHDLADIKTYAFSSSHAEPIRYSIDRNWQGELPRTYLFDANHKAKPRSGKMRHGELEAWIAQQAARGSDSPR